MALPFLILAAILLAIVGFEFFYASMSFHLQGSKTRAYVTVLCERWRFARAFLQGFDCAAREDAALANQQTPS
jgi:hypothetical protein